MGFFPKAVYFFERALERDEKNSLAMTFLGIAYLKSRHSQAAVDMLQKAVETAPENKRIYHAYLNALFLRGVRVCRSENWDLGSQMLRFVLKNGTEAGFKTGPLLHLELGRSYRELGRLTEALEHYTAALKFSPKDLMLRWYRSAILMELGRDEEARGDIEKIRALGAELPDLPWNSELVDQWMILSFMKAGTWRRAADACRNWIKRRGGNPAIHAMYAEAQRNMKAYKAAENHLKRAIELDGKSLELWYSLALCAWEGQRLSTLKKALNKVEELGGDPDIIARFSVLYEAETGKNLKRVIERLQQVIRKYGPETELMYALGQSYLKAGLLEEAESWFSKTVTVSGKHEKSWLGIVAAREAIFNEKAGNGEAKNIPAGVRSALEKAYRGYLKHWPDNLALRRDQALFLVRIRRYEQAAKKLEELLAWNPANPALRRVLAYSYRKLGRYRDAAVFLKALLKEKPGDLRLLLEYTGCLERIGGSQYARAILEKALHCFRDSSEILIALGLMAYREGRLERAFELLLEAVSRNKNDPRPYRWMANFAKNKGDQEGVERYQREINRIRRETAAPAK